MSDSSEPVVTLNQSPGNFYIFWNILVPLSVLFNIRHFGLRYHEIGLAFALLLNPYILGKIVHYPILTWLVVLFLIIWIERILRRWAWYQIYSWTFFRNLILLLAFIAIPSLILSFFWRPLQSLMPYAIAHIKPKWSNEQVSQYRDLAMLTIAIALLFHSMYFYSQCDHCLDISYRFKCWIRRPRCCPRTKCRHSHKCR